MTPSTPQLQKHSFSSISIDTWIGMFFSNLIAFFIIVTTAATLHTHGITKIDTAAQAAEALAPDRRAADLRAVRGRHHRHRPAGGAGAGWIGRLCGCRGVRLRGSLELPASRALGFYAIVGAATLGGAALLATNIDPIAMLFWTAVINGIVAVPIMIAMMVVVTQAARARRAGVAALAQDPRLAGGRC